MAQEREYKQAQKEEELANAARRAQTCENRLELLTSVHRDSSASIDWSRVAESERPAEPVPDTVERQALELAIAEYRPNFLEKLLGLSGRLRGLERELEAAKERERVRAEDSREAHAQATREWQASVAFASLVLKRDIRAFERVVDESGCLDELEELGCRVKVRFVGGSLAHVEMRAVGTEVVPDELETLTTKGKLSVKKMPKAQFWEVYQDFLCGAALRAGRELMAVLPLDRVLVDVSTLLENPGTGQEENACVLSVVLERKAIEKINFAKVDASNAIEAQKHSMRFSKGKGLSAVDSLKEIFVA